MILGQDSETGWWLSAGDGLTLGNIHPQTACEGRGCAIHNHPSNHRLKDAPLNWREDRGILERICVHDVGHPDPDSAAYLETVGQGVENVHGCCGYGCCVL